MNPGQPEKKGAVTATGVMVAVALIAIAVFGYFKKKEWDEEKAKRQLPPAGEDQAEKMLKRR